jgi:tetratricopeptide (TPR) repeat protein
MYEQNLRIFPRATPVLNRLASQKADAGAYDDALVLVDRSEAIAPQSSVPNAIRAFVADRQGDYGRARDLALQAANVGDWDNPWAWWFLGYLYEERLHDVETAKTYYEKAITNQPRWTEEGISAAQALAFILAKQGHEARAIDLWEQVIALDRSRIEVHHNLSRAYRKQGNPTMAAHHARQYQRARVK